MIGASGRGILSNPCADNDGYFFFDADASSRLNSGMTTRMSAVIILVDTKAIMGMELGTLADHFALLSLAEARQGRNCKEVESIANLMAKDCDPALAAKAITRNDIRMLTALYQVPDDRLQGLEQVRIQARIRRQIEADHAAGRD
jgi:hypothetical protein